MNLKSVLLIAFFVNLVNGQVLWATPTGTKNHLGFLPQVAALERQIKTHLDSSSPEAARAYLEMLRKAMDEAHVKAQIEGILPQIREVNRLKIELEQDPEINRTVMRIGFLDGVIKEENPGLFLPRDAVPMGVKKIEREFRYLTLLSELIANPVFRSNAREFEQNRAFATSYLKRLKLLAGLVSHRELLDSQADLIFSTRIIKLIDETLVSVEVLRKLTGTDRVEEFLAEYVATVDMIRMKL